MCSVIVYMMATSAISSFVDAPSVSQLVGLRKADLYAIANHYKISVPTQALKAELLVLVRKGLIEQGFCSLKKGESEVSEGEETAEGQVIGFSPTRSEEGVQEGPFTLPKFNPSPSSGHSVSSSAKLKLRLARLEIEQRDKEQARKFELEVKRLTIEADKEIRIRQLELEAGFSASPQSPQRQFEVSKNIALVPPFRESEVDSYFSAFERVAAALHWPQDVWSILLQCKLSGKAQEVLAALSLEDSLQYDIVKATVLRAYELVPEAYRQRFRNHKKPPDRTFVEFARDKESLFDRWCSASKANTFTEVKELMLLEEFKNHLPDRVVVHLNEQKVTTLAQAAVLADEYALTHKTVFGEFRFEGRSVTSSLPRSGRVASHDDPKPMAEVRECFYCHKVGHLIVDCPVLKSKPKPSESFPPKPKGMGFVWPQDSTSDSLVRPDPLYAPFLSTGCVSLTGEQADQKPIQILRDTGAAQSVILTKVLPWSPDSYCGSHVILQGIETSTVSVPLHWVNLKSDLVAGRFRVGVVSTLPVKGVTLLLGNDIAGGVVTPMLEVVGSPESTSTDNDLVEAFPHVFPACVLTRAQSRRMGDMVDLAGSVFARSTAAQIVPTVATTTPMFSTTGKSTVGENVSAPQLHDILVMVTPARVIEYQKEDPSLRKCFASVVSPEEANTRETAYFMEAGVLMRKWKAHKTDGDWPEVLQVVVPSPIRQQVLSLAHDPAWSGHLGITKTYNRVLRHFFWPGLKSDVVKFCRTCHACQLTGKANQTVPRAPLCPIPVVGEPFDRVIVDCVGPLPKVR